MSETLIRLLNIEKRYQGAIALHLDELELCRGDRVAIVGKNGSGKSTLLRVLGGLTRISSGNDSRARMWHELSIGYLPQEGGIYRDLSIRQNHVVFQRLLGKSGLSPSYQLRMAGSLGLSELLDHQVNSLSGGFRRLAAIYCFLASGAEVLFLDEPFASLDQAKQLAVEAALLESADRLALLVISEHKGRTLPLEHGALGLRAIQLDSRRCSD